MIPFKAVPNLADGPPSSSSSPTARPCGRDVKLQLKQAEKASTASVELANKTTNPTTRRGRARRPHVRDGDSLPSIAHRTYGDAGRWRLIAEANGVDDPLRLRRGTPLTLPRLDA